ncbi:MAG: PaaI family thioesterase [Hyphomonadaceae bacterium]|nr:PaaI family thioesterase [Hyphomonadaceae bacterium]
MSDDEFQSMAAIPQGYAPLDARRGFVSLIGPLYRRQDGERYSMAFRVSEQHTNGMANAHGGMLMSFADMAWGHVVAIETSSYWVTVRLTLDFLSSAKLGDWVEGGSEVLSRENDLYLVQGRIWNGDRTLITGSGMFKALERRDPRPGERAYGRN